MTYVYGMRLRGFGPGCQPMNGLTKWLDSSRSETGYHGFLWYDHKLTDRQSFDYDLDYLGVCDGWRLIRK